MAHRVELYRGVDAVDGVKLARIQQDLTLDTSFILICQLFVVVFCPYRFLIDVRFQIL